MKIWFQKHTVVGRNPVIDAAYASHAQRILGEGTEVRVEGLPNEAHEGVVPPVELVRYGQLEVLFSWYFAEQAIVAERAGYDAYVVGVAQDAGLEMARSLVSIPVVGYGEATFNLLQTRGVRFGVIGFISELEELLRENMAQGGSDASCAGFGYIEDGQSIVESALVNGDTSTLVSALERQALILMSQGAQVVVPGEGILNELLSGAGIHAFGDVPVIDPGGLALATAEMLARTRRLGLWDTGHMSYFTRRASHETVDQMRNLFSPAVSVSPRQQRAAPLAQSVDGPETK